MASPATDRLVKAEVRFTWGTELVENVLHFQHALDTPTPVNMLVLGQAIRDTVSADWLPDMNSLVTFREVYVEEYGGNFSQSATVAGVGIGGVVGDSMPPQNTLCLSLRTEFVGRSRRGRIYTIGMTETNQTTGIVTAGYRDAWLNNLNSLLFNTAAVNWAWVVASFWENGVERSTAQVTPITTILAVDDFVDTQRRRARGRGQ